MQLDTPIELSDENILKYVEYVQRQYGISLSFMEAKLEAEGLVEFFVALQANNVDYNEKEQDIIEF